MGQSLFGTPCVQLTDDDIQNILCQPVQLNGGPQLFMVLAFVEKRAAEMVTQDGANDRDAAWPSGQKPARRQLIDAGIIWRTDPLAKPKTDYRWRDSTRTGLDRNIASALRHRPFRFTWRGTDRVNVGSE